jgi:chloramphenicol-sensitive protein RarD
MNIGNWYAIGAYAIWGLLPIYLRLLRHVPALQLTSHRIIWSFILLVGIVLLSRQWHVFRQESMRPRILIIYTMAAMLLGINWLTYVWAVNAGFIVETSLGYFINPLLSVLLGIVFFRERLRQ